MGIIADVVDISVLFLISFMALLGLMLFIVRFL